MQSLIAFAAVATAVAASNKFIAFHFDAKRWIFACIEHFRNTPENKTKHLILDIRSAMHFKIDILTVQSDISTPNSNWKYSRIFAILFNTPLTSLTRMQTYRGVFFLQIIAKQCQSYNENQQRFRYKCIFHWKYPFSIHLTNTHTTLARYRHFVTIFTPPHYLVCRNKWNEIRMYALIDYGFNIKTGIENEMRAFFVEWKSNNSINWLNWNFTD